MDIPEGLVKQWERDRRAAAKTLRGCSKARLIEFALDYRDGWLAATYLLGKGRDHPRPDADASPAAATAGGPVYDEAPSQPAT